MGVLKKTIASREKRKSSVCSLFLNFLSGDFSTIFSCLTKCSRKSDDKEKGSKHEGVELPHSQRLQGQIADSKVRKPNSSPKRGLFSSSTPSTFSQRPDKGGLVNHTGAQCYWNASMQVLMYILDDCDVPLDSMDSASEDNPVSKAIVAFKDQFLNDSITSKDDKLLLRVLNKVIGNDQLSLVNNLQRQSDASELFGLILDRLMEENLTFKKSFQLRFKLTSVKKTETEIRYEPDTRLSVTPSGNSTLQECVASALECVTDDGSTTVTKTFSQPFPNYLYVEVKRFSGSCHACVSDGSIKKDDIFENGTTRMIIESISEGDCSYRIIENGHSSREVELSIEDFRKEKQREGYKQIRFSETQEKNTSKITDINSFSPKAGVDYHLVSAVVHRGGSSINSGHYVTYKNIKGQWKEFNDESVKDVGSPRIMFDEISSSGTILLYKKQS